MKSFSVEVESEESIYGALSYYIQKVTSHKNARVTGHIGHHHYQLKDDLKISTLFKYKGENVTINVQTYKDTHIASTAQKIKYMHFIQLQSISMDVLDKFIKHASDVYGTDHHYTPGEITMWTPSQYGEWNFYSTLKKREIPSVILDKDVKENMLSDVKTFNSAEHIYHKYGMPYKRVYCLYGPPGTGKTSIIFSIASYLGKDIAMLNFSSEITDMVFTSLIKNLPENTILLLEDIDSLSAKRNSSTSKSGHVSFSTLLNVLDGNLVKNGLMAFMTTNYIDKLDDALVRKGRTDYMVHISYITKYQLEGFAKFYYPKITKVQIAEYVKLMAKYKNLTSSKVSSFMFLNRDLTVVELMKLLKTKKNLD